MIKPTVFADNTLLDAGWDVLTAYADRWKAGVRVLNTERLYPELTAFFKDIRLDTSCADQYATQPEVRATSFYIPV